MVVTGFQNLRPTLTSHEHLSTKNMSCSECISAECIQSKLILKAGGSRAGLKFCTTAKRTTDGFPRFR